MSEAQIEDSDIIEEFDYDNIITEDDEPVDKRQEKLLIQQKTRPRRDGATMEGNIMVGPSYVAADNEKEA